MANTRKREKAETIKKTYKALIVLVADTIAMTSANAIHAAPSFKAAAERLEMPT